MANMASVAYAIEGSTESLKKIEDAIVRAIPDKEHWSEWKACEILGFSEAELDDKRLGGELYDPSEVVDGVLRFCAEERWGLQDFDELLIQKFPDIKVYWQVEECGCEIYYTNDKEGKYFPDRYWVDTCIDGVYDSEYFKTEEAVYKWLSKITNGRVKSEEDVDAFNANCEDFSEDNFIYIHEFEI